MKARLRLLAAVTALAAAAPAAPAPRAFNECSPSGVPARCGSIAMPENPEQPSGRQIRLSVVVVPALLEPARHALRRPARHGRSNDLECPDPGVMLRTAAALHRYVDHCLATVGGDPAWYGTRVAMDDLDTVRAALGYRSLDVYGTSYGPTSPGWGSTSRGRGTRCSTATSTPGYGPSALRAACCRRGGAAGGLADAALARPLLALVGGADPQDPIGNLTGLRRALPRSRVLNRAGPRPRDRAVGCLGSLVARFIDRGGAGTLDTSCIRAIGPPGFVAAG